MRYLSFLITIFSIVICQDLYEGYTLFTPQGGNPNADATTYLKDNNENTVHSWQHEQGPASMPYLIPGDESGFENTLLVYPYRVPNPTMDSGGVGGAVQIQNWNGDILWDYELSNDQYQHQ